MMIDSRPPSGRMSRYGMPIGQPTAPAPVLVIDDDPVGSSSTMALLAAGGYTTAAESHGDSVLRLVRSEVMRLVVAELYVACAEGRCVIAALKQDRSRLPRLRVLAYSRHVTPADDDWALAAGADAVLHKPARGSVLLREVHRLDGRGQLEPQPVFGGDGSRS